MLWLGYAHYSRVPAFGKKDHATCAFRIDRSTHLARHSRGKTAGVRVGARIDLPAPDPAPANRWTQKAFDLAFLGINEPLDQKHPLHIAVPDAKLRIRTRGTACSVFTRIPTGSFVDVGHGVAIVCLELVFAEMSAAMNRLVQLLLGYELCGGYSRDDVDPREGEIAYSVDPLSTPEAIGEYLEGCRHMPQIWQSREALPYLLGNAWSPIEAIIAQMIVLDPCESGYGLGEIELNHRVGAAKKGSRVPDILFAGTHVGLNLRTVREADKAFRLFESNGPKLGT